MAYNPYSSEDQDSTWYTAPKEDLHSQVFRHITSLEVNQAYLTQNNLRNMRLYGNSEAMRLNQTANSSQNALPNAPRVTLNIVSPMCDTVTSKIVKNIPKPQFLTDKGSWSMQEKAKKLTDFIDGLFYGMGFKALMTKAFRAAAIFGTGCVHFYTEDGEIKAEHVHIDEIKVDDKESLFTAPRTIHRVRFINKDVLKQMFPKDEFEIDSAVKYDKEFGVERQGYSEQMVYVVESWHLGSGKNFDGGRHSICISSKTLFEEHYKKNYFPFVFLRWQENQLGFWGRGIPEILTGTQLEINKILRTIQVAMHLVCIPKVFIDVSGKIVSAHLDTRIGGIIKHAGKEPTFHNMGTISPELFSHLNWLYQRAFEEIGISQLSSQSKLPPGLEAAVAMREYNNIESERFMDVGQRWEQAWMDATDICVDMAHDLYTEDKNLSVKVAGKSFIKTIKWKDVHLDEDKYILKCFPISSLSSTPAARTEEVTELLQAGFITKEDGLELLDFPDIKDDTNLYISAKRNIMWTIDEMMEHGRYLPPEPYQNLQLGIQLMQNSYLMYRTQNAPESRLELVRNWIADADAMLKTAAPSPMQAPIPGQPAQDLNVQSPETAASIAPPASNLVSQ